MKRRRPFRALPILLVIAGLAAPSAPLMAADDWPSQPVRILVSFPPGGASDMVARLLAQHLSQRLGQPFVIENRPGAAGTIAATALQQARSDGHTLMLSNLTPFNIAPSLLADVSYDPVDDFTHISYIGGNHLALFAHPDLGVTALEHLLEYASDREGELDYGSSGIGSWGHVIAERFKALAGVDIEHIPYQGSAPMVADFRAVAIPVIFDAVAQNLPLVAEGTALPLAVSSPERLDALADVPTFRELGYDVVAENWLGFSAPAGLDATIAGTLDAAVQDILTLPEVREQLEGWGIISEPKSADAFADFVADQYANWRPLVEAVRGS